MLRFSWSRSRPRWQTGSKEESVALTGRDCCDDDDDDDAVERIRRFRSMFGTKEKVESTNNEADDDEETKAMAEILLSLHKPSPPPPPTPTIPVWGCKRRRLSPSSSPPHTGCRLSPQSTLDLSKHLHDGAVSAPETPPPNQAPPTPPRKPLILKLKLNPNNKRNLNLPPPLHEEERLLLLDQEQLNPNIKKKHKKESATTPHGDAGGGGAGGGGSTTLHTTLWELIHRCL